MLARSSNLNHITGELSDGLLERVHSDTQHLGSDSD